MESKRIAGLTLTAILLAGCAASGSARVEPRLEGVANFREVGGYRTADGREMRRGILYRSAELSRMTARDRETLQALGIRYEIDLRSEQERTDQPTRWNADAPKVLTPFHYAEDGKHNPASTGSVAAATARVMSPAATVGQIDETLRKAYDSIVLDRAGEIGKVLHDLASEDAPALIHCAGGKDRTGITVAVLMTLLGVPRDRVYEEYLKSNDPLTLWYEQTKAKMQAAHQPVVSFQLFKARAGANPAWLDEAFSAMVSHYGSFEGYVRDGLKLTGEDEARLRTRFLRN